MADDHGNDNHGGAEGGEHKSHKRHGGSHGPGHGGGHEEHAGAPEWLISFADNVALLMGFFVILLAMNMSPKKEEIGGAGQGKGGSNDARWVDFIYGVREAFNNPPSADSKDPADRQLRADWEANRKREAENRRDPGTPGKFDRDQGLDRGSVVKPNLTVEFEEGRIEINRDGRALINTLAKKELLGKGFVIEVRGHVSATEAKAAERAIANVAGDAGGANLGGSGKVGAVSLQTGGEPVGSGAGYRLGYERAFAVASELAQAGIPWRNMRIMSCSDADRVEARSDGDPSKHRRNMRVEVILTNDILPADPASIEPGSSR